jgi:hypothetical protein
VKIHPFHGLSVTCAHTHARTNGICCHIVTKHDDVNIAANNEQVVPEITIDNKTLIIKGLPGHVRVHTWTHGDVETNMSSSIISTKILRSDLSSGTVSEEELGWMSCVVAGELEALSEAAPPNPEGVRDVDIPTSGWAVSQGIGGRDMQ